MSFPVPNEYDMPDIKYNNGNVITLPPSLSGDGTSVNLSQLEKDLILTLFSKAAYAENDAGTAYDTLENLWTAPQREVESITAVYTQSGTVYDTDTLDSLKADLVVTAFYSDSTSEAVPANAYTLSGTLTVGTSTITVNYAGLTDTFSVTVTSIRAIFGTFVNGHGVSKAAGPAEDVPKGGTYISSTSARAAFSTPIVNNGYVLTVTDSSKYNLAVYDITDNTPINCTYESAIEHVYYTGGSKSIAWKTSDSATTPYILVALKKMDNTAFTDVELANGAEAVFTFTTS